MCIFGPPEEPPHPVQWKNEREAAGGRFPTSPVLPEQPDQIVEANRKRPPFAESVKLIWLAACRVAASLLSHAD